MTRKDGFPWIIINVAHGSRLECLHCGEHYAVHYPAPVGILSAAGEAFEKSHKRCPRPAEGLRCHFCAKTGHVFDACPTLKVTKPEAWLQGPDTGASSVTIYCQMTGKWGALARVALSGTPRVPRDPDDFGRCYRLLALFPEWRARIGEMRVVPGWAALADAWGELEALYLEEKPSGEAPKLFARMRELIAAGGAR